MGVLSVTSPFIISARADTPIKIGMIDPLTGVYAAVAQNEVMGAKLAVTQINAAGGVLGRQLELLVEDSANDVGTGVQKARKLIDRDQVNFLIGDVNSGVAQAIAQVSNEKKVLHIVSGGHTDSITGPDCKWNVYRVCNTTTMEANSVCSLLFKQYGKKWHFITPDYAFGHTLQQAAATDLAKLGGTVTGNELTPLGTTDFSAYLIKARAANPDVILVLPQGSDMVNCLKQIVQFGLNQQIHVAGLQQELEFARGDAAGGAHRHLDVRMVLETAGRRRASTNSSPTSAPSTAARSPPRAIGSATLRCTRSPGSPTSRRRSTRWPWPRRSAISNCRPRSSCSPISATIAQATTS